MKIIVNENQRALLYKNGRFVKLLLPGKHHAFFAAYHVQTMDVAAEFKPEIGRPEQYLRMPAFAGLLSVIEVGDAQVALHFEDGRHADTLTSGLHAFWNEGAEHSFRVLDVREPEITGIERVLLLRMPHLVQRVEIQPGQKGLLMRDGVLVRLLDEGTHFYWRQEVSGVRLTVQQVDARLQQLNVQGQEVLSLDKVAVRVNFVCRYRIVDCVRAMTEISGHEEQLHVAAQLILREYIGQNRLDALLENREEMSAFVLKGMKAREAEFFIEVVDAGVRDIILPGEIREIMNTVLVAEKKAQANVITRREEVASTRSLMNTAKLMEENQVLMKLKEMEYLEKICENVGSITVNGGGDLLSQLAQMLKGA
ncbi:MAG TPA: SPFH domain-containing protein [Clostridia bacterium]|nr:SPFH domain-containing protein [Clostridia bacterium]